LSNSFDKLEKYKKENEYNDIFFEIISPEDISYTYRVRSAVSFGSSFEKTYNKIQLVPTIPNDGCSTLSNFDEIYGNVALVERG
jgi:hypothetical protein